MIMTRKEMMVNQVLYREGRKGRSNKCKGGKYQEGDDDHSSICATKNTLMSYTRL